MIVCRAFASLADFVVAIDRLAGPATLVAAMKGVLPIDEIAALPPAWALVEALPLQVTELVVFRHLLLLRRAAHARSADADGPILPVTQQSPP